MRPGKAPAVLLIGGLDPTGQAGLARDLAALAQERMRGAPVSSGTTVQTSGRFVAAHPTPPDVLLAQAEAALAEWDVQWCKVGALFSKGQVEAVADFVRGRRLRLVLDPVLASSSGAPFLDEAGVAALRDTLLPLAFLVTPNGAEAETLAGEADPARAAASVVALGASACLVKQSGAGPDLLFDGRALHELPTVRQPGRHRGTGCRLASRATALLARGVPLVDAARIAQEGLQSELAHDDAEQALTGARLAHFRELEAWLPRILAQVRFEDVPEVGMNVAYALPGATDPRRDVLGLAGRITIAGFGKGVTGRLAFGGPHHTGRLAVVLQEHDPAARVVMNHRHAVDCLENARRAGLVASGFRREDEPADAPSTMEWGLRHAIARNGGKVPDLVWDAGGVGKEAMIRVVARDPADLVRKLRLMHGGLAAGV
ncbi:MAG: hydroxymethylpyrimidine kinase / phosphomethylpyrimidine kinase / thiamine-phosphate diphosphorylase [Thermoplasmata archaeon]|jgi:hydroxymethylpyrimidine/phosphomethylpyrimidine kinase|nr:hydroxymethylpyrimidine kinase / phosphomethylpyrimidine kinase / thiamine-phosphate diphosphorylase [Thermoplasmata archaeon]